MREDAGGRGNLKRQNHLIEEFIQFYPESSQWVIHFRKSESDCFYTCSLVHLFQTKEKHDTLLPFTVVVVCFVFRSQSGEMRDKTHSWPEAYQANSAASWLLADSREPLMPIAYTRHTIQM